MSGSENGEAYDKNDEVSEESQGDDEPTVKPKKPATAHESESGSDGEQDEDPTGVSAPASDQEEEEEDMDDEEEEAQPKKTTAAESKKAPAKPSSDKEAAKLSKQKAKEEKQAEREKAKALKKQQAEAKKEERAAKKAKKTDGPKRARSGYMFFCDSERPKYREQHPDVAASDVMKNLASMWNGLSEEERAPYEEMAKEDKERYNREKPAEEPTAKRARSAFVLYGNSVRAEIQAENPDWKPTDVTREIGKRWKSLNSTQKGPFEALAKKDKERYEEEVKKYGPPPSKKKRKADDDEEKKPAKKAKTSAAGGKKLEDKIRAGVEEILEAQGGENVSKKAVRTELESKLKMDLTDHKDLITRIIEDYIANQE